VRPEYGSWISVPEGTPRASITPAFGARGLRMNPGRYWTGIPTKGWLVVVVVVVRTVVVVVGVGVGCRTTSSVVHDPKEIATPMKRTIRDMIAIDKSRPVESASPKLFFDRLTLPLGITKNDRSWARRPFGCATVFRAPMVSVSQAHWRHRSCNARLGRP
jgi:hypothetical protein